jgi:hypothetical protein
MQVNLRASADAIRLSRWQAPLTADLDSCAQKSSPKTMTAFGWLVIRGQRLKGAQSGDLGGELVLRNYGIMRELCTSPPLPKCLTNQDRTGPPLGTILVTAMAYRPAGGPYNCSNLNFSRRGQK